MAFASLRFILVSSICSIIAIHNVIDAASTTFTCARIIPSAVTSTAAASTTMRRRRSVEDVVAIIPTTTTMTIVSSLRGGGGGAETTAKKRKRRKSSTSSSNVSSNPAASGSNAPKRRKRKKTVVVHDDEEDEEEGQNVIDSAMKDKDAAIALGDAIRDRANVLRNDNPTIDTTLTSIGLALGNTDYTVPNKKDNPTLDAKRFVDSQDDLDLQQFQQRQGGGGGGGVVASPSAVLANYFLHSHGGSHGIQCFLSLCSILTGIASLCLPTTTTTSSSSKPSLSFKMILLQRSLLCAMTKHISGLLSASITSARSIKKFGYRNIQQKLNALALDPVSQYLFYCALMMIWIPNASLMHDATTTSNIVSLSVLGPILLREVISIMWVISDVIVLLHSTTTSSSSSISPSTIFLKTSSKIINAFMCMLFTPSKWSNANSYTKQFLLATLVSKVSIIMECITCVIVVYDAIVQSFLFEYALKTSSERTMTLWNVIQRLICAKLYMNFMMTRRKKIYKVVSSIEWNWMIHRFLDILLDPLMEMGLVDDFDEEGDDEGSTSGLNGLNIGSLLGLGGGGASNWGETGDQITAEEEEEDTTEDESGFKRWASLISIALGAE